MAALLVALGVMSVMLTVAMPVWHQMARREKEAELIFRGEQYKRAFELYQRRNGPGVAPPSIDALVDGKFLRRPFKDPITGEDFQLIRQGAATEGRGATPAAPGQGRGGPLAPAPTAPPGRGAGAPLGGIVGVASTSTEESLRVYNGRTRYNEWDFTYVQQVQAPGAGAGAGPPGGRGDPGGRGGPGVQGPIGIPGVGGRGGERGRGGPGDPGRGRSLFGPFDGQGSRGGAPPPQQPPRR